MRTPERCLVVHPVLKTRQTDILRSVDDQVQEIESLTRAISLELCAPTFIVNLAKIQPGAYLGKGQREHIAALAQEYEPAVIIMNCALSPVQQRNLEREWQTKVIDRTGLILEIFGARAQTREGKLQVELAALEYQKSRLVRSWTHLERQRGGTGFMGGPGETQIEIDRRIIGDKITRLKKDLEDVRRTRDLGRKARQRVPYPVISLVGYTNAGKSTLFNTLTKSNVFAKDLLFATLDPTMRRLKLPNGQIVILSDTVGFISDLPTHLVAAFRATLEQVLQADVIVHVIDYARPDHEAQRQDVIGILEGLGLDYDGDFRILELLNKADCLDRDALSDARRKVKFDERTVLISASDGQGLDDFKDSVCAILSRSRKVLGLKIPSADGRALSWLYAHAEILERSEEGESITLKIHIEPAMLAKFEKQFSYQAGAST